VKIFEKHKGLSTGEVDSEEPSTLVAKGFPKTTGVCARTGGAGTPYKRHCWAVFNLEGEAEGPAR